jgi:hypothetical protein
MLPVMTMRNFILLFALLAVGLTAAAATPANPAKAAATPPPPEAALKQAMPAAQVLQIMGKPSAIEPMKDAGGKAEVWVYVRKVNPTVRHEQVAATPIMIEVQDSNGTMRKYQQGENIQFADIHYYTEEKVQLLLFNDKFVVAKIARREVKEML